MIVSPNYPYWRVIIGFTLCPAIVALLVLGAMMIFSLFAGEGFVDAWDAVGGLATVLFISVLTALYFFGVPAFLLALLYAFIKLRKSFYAYLVTFVAGGAGAQIWVLLPISPMSVDDEIFNFPGAFLMGAVSSLIMAFLVLPKHSPKDESALQE